MLHTYYYYSYQETDDFVFNGLILVVSLLFINKVEYIINYFPIY